MQKQIPFILYMWVQKKAYDKSVEGVINKKEFPKIFCRYFHVPKKLWWSILREMERIEMLEKINNVKFKIINIDKNILENLNELQRNLEFF